LLLSAISNAEDLKEYEQCGSGPEAQLLAKLIITDALQQRKTIKCNSTLTSAAYDKAILMRERGLVMHNLGGSPNNWLRDRGFELPSYYGGSFSNQVEAIAGGYRTAKGVWHDFKRSKAHKEHLLGELEFFQEQDQLGVAYYRDVKSLHDDYWVIYLTKGTSTKEVNKFEESDIPNKSNLILKK